VKFHYRKIGLISFITLSSLIYYNLSQVESEQIVDEVITADKNVIAKKEAKELLSNIYQNTFLNSARNPDEKIENATLKKIIEINQIASTIWNIPTASEMNKKDIVKLRALAEEIRFFNEDDRSESKVAVKRLASPLATKIKKIVSLIDKFQLTKNREILSQIKKEADFKIEMPEMISEHRHVINEKLKKVDDNIRNILSTSFSKRNYSA
jgi:hypothetical protein